MLFLTKSEWLNEIAQYCLAEFWMQSLHQSAISIATPGEHSYVKVLARKQNVPFRLGNPRKDFFTHIIISMKINRSLTLCSELAIDFSCFFLRKQTQESLHSQASRASGLKTPKELRNFTKTKGGKREKEWIQMSFDPSNFRYRAERN